MRNIGSSIGISIVISLLTRNTQINHAELAGIVTPFNPALARARDQPVLEPWTAAGQTSLDAVVSGRRRSSPMSTTTG